MAVVKVLIVEDSELTSDILKEALESDYKIRVVGVARNGREALDMLPKLNPDLITIDVYMPVMDGFETVRQIMTTRPTPILVITSSNLKQDVQLSLRMVAAGALDVIEKPPLRDEVEWARRTRELTTRVKLFAEVKVKTPLPGPIPTKRTGITGPIALGAAKPATPPTRPVPPAPSTQKINVRPIFPADPQYQLIAIASSTGGPNALLKILQALPTNLPCGIVVVQHISQGFTQGLVDWLARETSLNLRMAMPGEMVGPSTVLVAPDRFNMSFSVARRIELRRDGEDILRPNADVLMNSVARVFRERAIGIVLTGMGTDGASGLKSMRDVGAYTITQDEATSLIFGMPKAAYDLGASCEVLPLGQIARRLVELCQLAKVG